MIQASLPIGVIPYLFFAFVVPLTILFGIWVYSTGMRQKSHKTHTGMVIVACLMVALLLGSSFATAGPPGPQPVVSDSSRFIDTGTNSFTVIDSPYLSPVVTLDGWGAGSYFSGGTGWITVTFSQNEATVASRTFYVAVTSSSEPAAEGNDNVRLDSGTYEVEVLAILLECDRKPLKASRPFQD